jgi:apolipoprotein N-acyltransferase
MSGVLLGLAFPPTDWKPLAWVALVPFLIVVRSARAGAALLWTWLWTHVLCLVLWQWGPSGVTTYFQQSRGVALALFFGLATTMLAPYFMAFVLAYRRLARRFSSSLPLLAAAAWAAAELLRSRLFTGSSFFSGNPWGLLGYSQVGFDSFVQIASVTGVYGISFALAAVNAALAETWLSLRAHEGVSLRTLGRAAAAVLPALFVVAFGMLALRDADEWGGGAPGTEVAIVQGNVGIGARWRSDLYGRNLRTYLELTNEALELGNPEIVFWPETAMTFFVGHEPSYQRAIRTALAPAGSDLVAGAPHHDERRYFNSVFLVSPDDGIVARYDKHVLVPFAEFFPFGGIDLLRRSFGRIREFTPGETTPLLPTRAGPAGILVCNEAWFPEISGRRARAGAGYLVNLSNESWFEKSFTEQSFQMVRMRAIEQRRYVLRAAMSGPSGIVDPWGRVPTLTRHDTQEVVLGMIRSSAALSVYGRVGDLFGVACIVIILVGLVAPGLRSRRSRRRLEA